MSVIRKMVTGAAQAAGNFAKSFVARDEATAEAPADVLARTSPGGSPEKEWTVLVYLEGRHQLAHSTEAALRKMQAVGSSADVNVVAQASLQPTVGERLYPDLAPMPSTRFFVEKGKTTVVDTPADTKLSEQSLKDFVSWGMRNFPAKRTMLVIKKHGLGFAKIEPQAPLSARDTRAALEAAKAETGKGVDVVSFDSCSMQQLEVAYELKDVAKVMTGSQEDIFAIDYPYHKVLSELEKDPKNTDAAKAGAIVVDAHRTDATREMHTAVDLQKVGAAGQAMSNLVKTIKAEKLDRAVLYTCMLRTASMEPQESMRLAYNFRDVRGFLQHLADDPEVTSEAVREAARQADAAISASVVDHHITNGKKRLKNAQGLTTFVPWKDPSPSMKEAYEKLAWNRDTAWNEMLDYVFEPHAPSAAPTATPKVDAPRLSPMQWLGKKALHGYKAYISPYLLVSCRCKPSCSQYTRQAVEKHGLVEGTKLGFMRLLTCAGAEGVIDDPVPGIDAKASLTEPPPVLIDPPARTEKSPLRQKAERMATLGARMAGRMAGGIGGALVALPVGIGLGASLGWMAGRATIDKFNRSLLDKYPREAVREMVKLEHKVGDVPFGIYKWINTKTGSARMARVVAGSVGAVGGGVLGALGAAWKGWGMGGLFGGLWAGNALKDRFGELPKHPYTESVLRHDYQS